ncbi:ABC transporter permease [Aeribacillus pallidus]|uniref:ABC transporter permease n=1 Tax=Aeribacillus TaxID=1055323 RepID=UPI0028728398|nr:ABC transporter permease [Aeribacillus pallidus]MED1440974.1 ABC transporter permease [Aeribacillus composti]
MNVEAVEKISLKTEDKKPLSIREKTKVALLPVVIIITLIQHQFLPDKQIISVQPQYSWLLLIVLFFSIVLIAVGFSNKSVFNWLENKSPFLTFVFVILIVWEIITQKLNLLPMPFFPSPVKIFEAIIKDKGLLAISTLHSLRLLFIGYLIGALVGFITGILLAWYQKFRYWVNPFLRLIGPVPATAWIPVVLVVFPNSFSASTFLIALSTWFSVSIMTWTGVASVSNSYFEVAKTLGANERYLILRVAIPSAFPSIFVGLFMGLGVSFVTLIVAEMLGVKAGLGWYIQWAQGWAEYYKVYAALLIMAVLFSCIIAIFFKIRDRILIYQKGMMKW